MALWTVTNITDLFSVPIMCLNSLKERKISLPSCWASPLGGCRSCCSSSRSSRTVSCCGFSCGGGTPFSDIWNADKGHIKQGRCVTTGITSNKVTHHKYWGLQWCYEWLGQWFPTFRRIVMSSSSGSSILNLTSLTVLRKPSQNESQVRVGKKASL